MTMTYKEFLEGPIKNQIKSIGLGVECKCNNCNIVRISNPFPWHAFALDAIAIEFIGKISKCKSSKEIEIRNMSSDDFIYGIEQYFPLKYRPYSEFLYKNLRCGMAHFFGAKSKISLSDKEGKNLDILENGNLLLVFKDFHEDLCCAIDKLIKENKPLIDKQFLEFDNI